MLVDRCCENGGWNYGNSNMLGKELRPYVPTTAIALMALQKPQKERSIAVVSKSLDYLQRAAASEPSGMAIALASLALRVHARPSDAAPLAGQISRTVELGNQLGMSMSLLALESHASVASMASMMRFRLPSDLATSRRGAAGGCSRT